MKVIDAGHVYQLQSIDDENFIQHLVFVKREGEGYPGNVGHHPGTIIQDVLRSCIDRLKYVDEQISHPANTIALLCLRHAIYILEMRAAERHNTPLILTVEETRGIENLPTGKNGHLLFGAGYEGS